MAKLTTYDELDEKLTNYNKSTKEMKDYVANANTPLTERAKYYDEHPDKDEEYQNNHGGKNFMDRISSLKRVTRSGHTYYPYKGMSDVSKEVSEKDGNSDVTDSIRAKYSDVKVVKKPTSEKSTKEQANPNNPTPKKSTEKQASPNKPTSEKSTKEQSRDNKKATEALRRVTQGSGIVYTPIKNKQDKSTRYVGSTPKQRGKSDTAYKSWQAQQRAAYERARASAADRGERVREGN